MPSVAAQLTQIPVGRSIPEILPHAISVSLPTWKDNVAYEEGELGDVMVNGYPRFFVHLSIQKLAAICEKKFGQPGELSILLPTHAKAEQCRAFLLAHSPTPIKPRIVHFAICASADGPPAPAEAAASLSPDVIDLQIVFFPGASWPLGKAFWQHAGEGISSRRADRCLELLGESIPGREDAQLEAQARIAAAEKAAVPAQPQAPVRPISYSKNRHYSRGGAAAAPTSLSRTSSPAGLSSTTAPQSAAQPPSQAQQLADEPAPDHSLYVEQRYGRNLPTGSAEIAKQALRRRIAGVLDADETATDGRRIGEEDVWLFPTGMSAIYNAHIACLTAWKGQEKMSSCFGFPYTDTLKVLEKWGPGCHFFGHGNETDFAALEKLLADGRAAGDDRPLQALFCEFPSNPLLRSPDLVRLRALANDYGFVIVVDETIGNFVNVEVLQWADMVVSSLTKIFSGDANVMGGSLVLNPKSPHYERLRSTFDQIYEDTIYGEDAIFMERNSRDFRPRIATINQNSELLCDFLRARSLADDRPPANAVLKDVFYPKWSTAANYIQCRRKVPPAGDTTGRFGGLFSLTFTSTAASEAFYDTLRCAKGPSLGTNFTLASPYALLAHYTELPWAATYGVDGALVRVSVGMEPYESLFKWFEEAIVAAEATVGAVAA